MSSNPIPQPIEGRGPGPIKIPTNPPPGTPATDPNDPLEDAEESSREDAEEFA